MEKKRERWKKTYLSHIWIWWYTRWILLNRSIFLNLLCFGIHNHNLHEIWNYSVPKGKIFHQFLITQNLSYNLSGILIKLSQYLCEFQPKMLVSYYLLLTLQWTRWKLSNFLFRETFSFELLMRKVSDIDFQQHKYRMNFLVWMKFSLSRQVQIRTLIIIIIMSMTIT